MVAPHSILETALAARLAYEQAVNDTSSDGCVSAATWSRLADDLFDSANACALLVGSPEAPYLTPGVVETLRSRAVDAQARAQNATRMVAVARTYRCIDMGTLAEAN